MLRKIAGTAAGTGALVITLLAGPAIAQVGVWIDSDEPVYAGPGPRVYGYGPVYGYAPGVTVYGYGAPYGGDAVRHPNRALGIYVPSGDETSTESRRFFRGITRQSGGD